jgi:putative endonuclease
MISAVVRSKRQIGQMGEAYAVAHLEGLGFDIVGRNYHSRYGEIDIIGRKNGVTYFFEVRSRVSDDHYFNFESIDSRKIAKITKTIYSYLGEHRVADYRLSFISVLFGDSYSLKNIDMIDWGL